MKKYLFLATFSFLSFFQVNAQCSYTVSATHTNVSCNGGSNGTINLTVTPNSTKGLLLSEIFTNPSGNDSPFEFVELIATKYIDFSITPYSVICTSNGVANPQGWISSAALSYAFEISTGTVNAGQVIYVGGSSMTPTSNIYRSIATDITGGDGFCGGASLSGILGNGGADADGVAVFNGAVSTLTGNSVPDDAIFFGSSIGTAFVNTTQGYQLPVNDHYAGGKLQTNSFLSVEANQGEYLLASGTYNVLTSSFTTPRTWSTSSTFTNLSSSVLLTNFYTFTWSNTATTEDISGLSAGTYMYVVSDGSCTVNGFVVVTQPTAITASFSTTGVSCNGGNNGSATITASGGTPGYTYSWSSGGTGTTETNLTAQNYNCTITDANGCISTQTVNVSQPNVLATTFTIVPPSCNAGNNGSLTAIPSGGTGPFTYSWSPSGGTNATASGLVAGNYTVTIVDSHTCTVTATVALVEPTPVNTFISGFTDVSCNGGNNGTASTITTGGTPGYSYVWSPSGGNAATGTGLTIGNYTCTIIDANGCGATLTVAITQPNALTGTISFTPTSCFGGSNGTATVVASGGVSPYTYSWSSGGTSSMETGLSAGTVSVTITDANLCSTTRTITITQPTALLTGINTFTNPTCNGGNNGIALVNAIGGTPVYTFLWSPFGGTNATGVGLTAGTFTCAVTDANGCVSSATVTLTQPTPIVITASATNATCGFNDGTATASATGGNPSYTYAWSPAGGNNANAIGLFAGFYTVTVTDAIGCTNTQQVSVLNPNAPTITPFSFDVTCFGTTNGSASVVASGGNPGYTYLWSTGSTLPNVNTIGAGTYTITVTDQSSCIGFTQITITQPPQIMAAYTSINETCNGGNNGSATVVASGGVPGYTYSWSSGGTNTTEAGLFAGTYTLTITDANACAVQSTVAITEPPAMQLSFINTAVTCSGGNNGSASATVSGGTSPYSYSWSSGGNASIENNLSAGIYTLTVTDANACSVSVPDTIVEAPAIIFSSSNVGVNCSYDSTGSATVIPSGGISPYTFLWSTGGTSATEDSLTGGTYTVTATDSIGCSSSTTVTVASPSPITFTSVTTGNTCSYGTNGTATITASGGTPGYTYSWSNGGFTNTQSGLATGTYTVITTDQNDCHFPTTVTINAPLPITIATTITDAGCNGGTNGGASIVASGGTPSYSYLWSTGSTTTSISNVGGGFYTVTITDNNSCVFPFIVLVTNPNAPVVSVVTTSESCNGGHTGAGVSTVTGGNPGYTYSWTGGGTGPNDFNLTAGNYTLTVTDQSGCQGFGLAIVTQPPPAWLNVLGPDTTICLPANSYVLCAPSVFSTYAWSNTATTSCITATSNGCYSVITTDGNGCISMDTACLTFTSCVGIDEEEISSFEIFPNPTSSQINISLGDNVESATMEIYSAQGKLMESKIIHATEIIDVTTYAKGMYFVRVNGEAKRIIVE